MDTQSREQQILGEEPGEQNRELAENEEEGLGKSRRRKRNQATTSANQSNLFFLFHMHIISKFSLWFTMSDMS